MKLRNRLEEYTKEELLDIARNYQFRGFSGLKKGELIQFLVENIRAERTLRPRLLCLTGGEMQLFRSACDAPQEVKRMQIFDSMQLYLWMLGGHLESSDEFVVYEEIRETFLKMDDKKFREEQKQREWLMECIHFAREYYQIFPVEVMYQIVSLNSRCSMQEMLEMIWEIPIDMCEMIMESMEDLGFHDWPKDDPIYSETGLLVKGDLYLDDEEFDRVLKSQMGKEFYIPSVNQIREINQEGYEASLPEYQKIKNYLIQKNGMSEDMAAAGCMKLWATAFEGENPAEFISAVTESETCIMEENDLREFVRLVMEAYNNSRMYSNRAHTPLEIARNRKYEGAPTIVPGSTQAAEMLQQAAGQLREMGISVDFDSNAEEIPIAMFPNGMNGMTVAGKKKIYPNDPCPCGSGKKYKKCCGR